MVEASTASALAGLATIMVALAIVSAICGGALLAVSIASRRKRRSTLRTSGNPHLSVVPTPEYAGPSSRTSGEAPWEKDKGFFDRVATIPNAQDSFENARQEKQQEGPMSAQLAMLERALKALHNEDLDNEKLQELLQVVRGHVETTAAAFSHAATPPTELSSEENRLPVFDTLESDWFRRSGKTLSPPSPRDQGPQSTPDQSGQPGSQTSWTSPADEGWRAAQAAASPMAAGSTQAGLPKRVPRANLIPGTVGVGTESGTSSGPVRSADEARNKLASFQRGVREAEITSSSRRDNPSEREDDS